MFMLVASSITVRGDVWLPTERGPHHTTWMRTLASGRISSYVELGTGLNYFTGKDWQPSREVIVMLRSGFAVATQAQHRVIWAPTPKAAGALDVLWPDGKRFRSHVLGLAYTDRATGRGVMIASVRDAQAVLVPPNQLLYP